MNWPHHVRPVMTQIVVVSSCLFLTGCWGTRDLDTMSIVVGVGIDQNENGVVTITEQVINPVGLRSQSGMAGSTGKGTFEHQASGRTVEEAFGKFQDLIYRTPYYGHNAVVIFGEPYARHGIEGALDYFERHLEFRKMQILLVTTGPLEELVKPLTGGVERLTSHALLELIEHGRKSTKTLRSTELRVINDLLSPSHTVIIPVVNFQEEEIELTGLALFRGTKLASILPVARARGLLWLLGDGGAAEVVVPCPHSPTGNGVHILNAATTVRPVVTRSGLVFNVRVRGNAEVRRLCAKDRMSPGIMTHLAIETAYVIQSEIQTTLANLQAQHLDAAQFGSQLFRSNPRLWRRLANHWDETFASLHVLYDVRINVLRSGLIAGTPDSGYTKQQWPPKSDALESKP